MAERRIKVTAYSGYRGEESPRAFIRDGERIEIVEVLDRRVEEGVADRITKRWFKVKGSDGLLHTMYYDEHIKEWIYTEDE